MSSLDVELLRDLAHVRASDRYLMRLWFCIEHKGPQRHRTYIPRVRNAHLMCARKSNSGVFQWRTKQIKASSLVGSSKGIILLDSSNLDRRNRIRGLSSSGELQARNKEAKRPSVATVLKDKRTKRRIEREHNTCGLSRLEGPILVRPSQWASQMTLGTERSGS